MINDPFEEVVILEEWTPTFSWLVISVIKFGNGAQADSLAHHGPLKTIMQHIILLFIY
jgi:hypothetical protein